MRIILSRDELTHRSISQHTKITGKLWKIHGKLQEKLQFLYIELYIVYILMYS